MFDEYCLDRKLTDNELHIPRMEFHDHARETLEFPLSSGTSFCRCPSLRVFKRLDDHYDSLLCRANQIFDSGMGSLFWRPQSQH